MTGDLILYFLFLGGGVLIGMNIKQPMYHKNVEEPLPKDVVKLREELVVYKNLKDSLLQDVRYWRDKATKNVIQK
jgi:hypothetical protein